MTLAPEPLTPGIADAQLAGFDLLPRLPLTEPPSVQFRILRALDLVALDVRGYGITLGIGANGPELLAGDGARLEVRHTFQHAAEEVAIELADNLPQPPPPPVPVRARAAHGSRLVYTVPTGTRIEYSSAGVLAALSRLELVVVPLALPRPVPRLFRPGLFDDLVTIATLPGGLRMVRTELGLALTRASAATRRTGPVAAGPATTSLLANATALRTARTLLAREGGLDLTGRDLVRGGFDLGGVFTRPGTIVRPRRVRPREPRQDETAIEAPYRVVLSPSAREGFTHSTTPKSVAPTRPGDPERVELWHSRLGVRHVDADGNVTIDETPQAQKIVRAVWARDMDVPGPGGDPFTSSLNVTDRLALVRQSADPTITTPEPVSADGLALSALGAWLDLHGRWDTRPYDQRQLQSVTSWDHQTTGGRDQYVRVEYPYYLFPIGHKCAVVKISERKVKEVADPQAYLYQRTFIVVQEPTRSYDDPAFPFIQVTVRPLVTPNLDPNGGQVMGHGDQLFWPTVGGQNFAFVLDCLDRDGRRVLLRAPMLAVSASLNAPADIRNAYAAAGPIPAEAQSVAFAPSQKPGDTAYETNDLRLTGDPGAPGARTSRPYLVDANLVVPAMKHLVPGSGPVNVKYAQPYLTSGFAGPNATSQTLFELTTMTTVSFGGGTDRAGGFVQPDLPVRGLSRTLGLVGDQTLVTAPTAASGFDPSEFLKGVVPKLFGLFSLVEILEAVGLDQAPAFVTDQLDRIGALLRDLDSLRDALEHGADRLLDDAATAATSKLRQQAQDAQQAIEAVRASFGTLVGQLTTALDALMALDTPSDIPAVTAAVSAVLTDLGALVTTLQTSLKTLPMPTAIRAELDRLAKATAPLLDAAAVLDTITAISDFVNGFDPSELAVKASFEWRPTLTNFPATALTEDEALFFVDPKGFVLSIEARASGKDGVGFDAVAELSDFGLNLFPDAPLVKIRFDRIGFRASSGGKPEVDVVFNGLEWCGVLSFITTLQELIPFDGFSDPPYVDVSTDGVTAGFDLALPSVAVGVFSLENISLGADVRVPFLGDAVTVGFNFCTREKPFRLTVMCIGGGGFVGMRLSPKGLVLLEMALEATACLSVDLVVASGSVSVSVGVYLRLEDDKGSLTGYFRIRGEVDVLGLISASITLELSLTYEFDTGKMVGRASISIEVEIFFLSFSVEVSCERRLAGSNDDPTFAEFLGIEPGIPLPDVPAAWSDYCAAFAGV